MDGRGFLFGTGSEPDIFLLRGSGGTGRRARLRIWWGNPSGFESRLSHLAPHHLRRSAPQHLLRICSEPVIQCAGVTVTTSPDYRGAGRLGAHSHELEQPGNNPTHSLQGRDPRKDRGFFFFPRRDQNACFTRSANRNFFRAS